MAIDELMNDHNEDLYEFVVNHFGMTSRESENICESTSKAIRDLENDSVASFTPESTTSKKEKYLKLLTAKLTRNWLIMGLDNFKIRQLTQKFIPFVVSIIMYKFDERRYEKEELFIHKELLYTV